MKTTRCLIVALLASSSVAFAQVSGNLNAAGGVTNRVLPPAQTQLGAGTNDAAGVNANRPLPTDPNAAANGNAAAQIHGPNSLNAAANSDAAVQAHGPNAASAGMAKVTAALSPSNTMRDIRSTAFDARKPVLNEVSDRIDAGGKLVDTLKHDPRALNPDVRTEFNSALEDVKVKEQILKRTLKTARNANADAWSGAQGTLAADYEDYAAAVEALNAII